MSDAGCAYWLLMLIVLTTLLKFQTKVHKTPHFPRFILNTEKAGVLFVTSEGDDECY